MACPSCGHTSRPDAGFCTACGTRLGEACPACGTRMELGEKFCAACGTSRASLPPTPEHLAAKILASRAALQGERKQVTVLFADVKGSMELAEGLDAEDFHHVMQRFAALLAEGVHRFEGTVTQFTGDGIMALFGAPISHEDHAARACYAALHLRDELRRYADGLRLAKGLNFSVRMGLNSGEVVVGKIGDDLRMDYTAQGHTVGLAQRMEQIAEPGHIYLTESTARLVGAFFRLRDLGPLAVKGASTPVRIHELEGVGPLRTRLDLSRTRGFSRFVGRTDEMAALEAAMANAIDGTGQVVGVVGAAGVGKSRLCFEFLERCRARGAGVHQGHCVAHGRTIPFLPMLELVRDYFGITEHDGDHEARRKIAGTVLLLDESFRDVLPLLFDFLGVGDPERPAPRLDPEAQQRQLRTALRRLAEARSRERAVVFLIDDLHWIDPGSETLVAGMVEWVPGTRTVLLVNLRPEYDAEWMRKPHYRRIGLAPLGADAAAVLVRELLGPDTGLAGLAERILERTAGNPFFIEEMVQTLAESGALAGTKGSYRMARPIADLVLPPTVQTVLAARIDRLPEREKEVLQTAAVIGREFSAPVLRRVAALPDGEMAAALAVLEAGDFVHPTALYPEPEYAFKHPLTQEVAYRSQLAERRRTVHAAVAAAVEELHPTKLDEHSALLAHHREAAGEALVAARWHRRAAVWLGARDRAQTFLHWRAVCRLLERVPESPADLLLAVEARAQIIFNAAVTDNRDARELERLFEEGRQLAARLETPSAAIPLYGSYALSLNHGGESAAAVALCEQARRLTDERTPLLLHVRIVGPLYSILVGSGRLPDARRVRAEIVPILRDVEAHFGTELFGFSPLAMVRATEAFQLVTEGRIGEATPLLEQALGIARPRHDREVLLVIHRVGTLMARLLGDPTLAMRQARETAAIGDASAAPTVSLSVAMNSGSARFLGGEPAEAAELFREGLAIARRDRTNLFQEALALAWLADALRETGSLEEALATGREAVAVGRSRGTLVWLIEALLASARAQRAAGGVAEAEVEEADRLVESTGARGYEPFVRIERAWLAADERLRQKELAEAQRLFAAMGATRRAEEESSS